MNNLDALLCDWKSGYQALFRLDVDVAAIGHSAFSSRGLEL